MKTITFDANGRNAPAYGCNKPGDNSGEHVPADVARELYEALEALEALTDNGNESLHPVRKRARASLAKARGE